MTFLLSEQAINRRQQNLEIRLKTLQEQEPKLEWEVTTIPTRYVFCFNHLIKGGDSQPDLIIPKPAYVLIDVVINNKSQTKNIGTIIASNEISI